MDIRQCVEPLGGYDDIKNEASEMPKYQVTVYAIANVVTEIVVEADNPEEAEYTAVLEAKNKADRINWEVTGGADDFEAAEEGPVEVADES